MKDGGSVEGQNVKNVMRVTSSGCHGHNCHLESELSSFIITTIINQICHPDIFSRPVTVNICR